MGSRFIEKKLTNTGKKGGVFQAPEKPILAWFQFVPATVVDTITNAFSPFYETDRDLYSVIVNIHYEDAFGKSSTSAELSTEKYYPLFTSLIDPPVKGEQVLVCTFGGVNYYIGPVNTLNLPNYNPDTLKSKNFSSTM